MILTSPQILLDFLTSADIIKPTNFMSLADISVGLNSLLICFEMIIFAILHLFAFTWREYDRGPHKTTPIFASLVDAFNPWDIVRATARGTRWLVCGVNNRRDDAKKVLERQKSDESSGLVGNAAGFASRESLPPPGHDGGLSVYHPTPSDSTVEVNTLKVQTSRYYPEPVEMTNSALQPGRQRPHAPLPLHNQQAADNGYIIAPPPAGPHRYHDRYRDQSLSPVERQGELAYPTVSRMPGVSEFLHSPTSPGVVGANSPMLPITGRGQQKQQDPRPF